MSVFELDQKKPDRVIVRHYILGCQALKEHLLHTLIYYITRYNNGNNLRIRKKKNSIKKKGKKLPRLGHFSPLLSAQYFFSVCGKQDANQAVSFVCVKVG